MERLNRDLYTAIKQVRYAFRQGSTARSACKPLVSGTHPLDLVSSEWLDFLGYFILQSYPSNARRCCWASISSFSRFNSSRYQTQKCFTRFKWSGKDFWPRILQTRCTSIWINSRHTYPYATRDFHRRLWHKRWHLCPWYYGKLLTFTFFDNELYNNNTYIIFY